MPSTMRYALTSTLCLAIVLGHCPPAAAADAAMLGSLLVTTDSRWEGAALVSANDDLKWMFKLPDGSQRTVDASKVIRWGSFSTAVGGHRVRLSDGGEFVGHSLEIRGKDILLVAAVVEQVRLPRGAVLAVIFDMPADHQSARSLEKRITSVAADNDTLLFTNGDQLTGHIVELINDKLVFKSAAADVLVDRARVAAVVFQREKLTDQVVKRGLRIWVGLRDGSRTLARNVDVAKVDVNDASASIEMLAGDAVSVKTNDIVALQPIGGDAAYLSDLHDAGYRHIPFLSQAWDFRRDTNVTGGPLVADGHRFLKGLGMHSAARITYNLDREYRAFQSALAIDDSTAGRGSVTCRVFTDDGSGQWRLKYESPVVRGGEKPISVDIDLAGAKRLSLLVDFADRGDEQDHVDWLDARLIR
jgi:hypothetical protein